MRAPRLRRRRTGPGLRRGIYLVPSLFTVANIFFGFLAVIAATRGQMERSAIYILVANLADVLDGRIARLTGSTSSFGEVYDSIADVVSFGLAPALLAFQWGLWQVPRVGMAVAFLFLVAGSIRLARFSSRPHDAHTFVGLPIPAGSSAIALLVLLSPAPVQHSAFIPVVAGFVLCVAVLMVSNLPYRSFKDVNLRRQWPATTLFIIALAFSLITLTPHVLSLLLAVYILSAPVKVVAGMIRRRPTAPPPVDGEESFHADDPDDAQTPDP
jgi:CDP-diacylglycerol--serine O-phosphatidyltransferase